MSRIEIKINKRSLVLETKDFDGTVDVDDLLAIHYENIPGEVITIPVLLNRVGLLKAEAEGVAKKSKLEAEIHESLFKKNLRRQASLNGNYFKIDGERIKLSEKSLEESVKLDKVWQEKYYKRIDAETNYEFISVLYWSLSEKSKKLDNLIKGTTPQEFEKDIIEGVVNDMVISNGRISIVEARGRS